LHRRHQPLLEFRRRRQPKLATHRLVRAIDAVQPDTVVMNDAAALDARQNIAAGIPQGGG